MSEKYLTFKEYPEINEFCPFCGTDQIQLIKNVYNPEHSKAKCRLCKAEARVSTWNTRTKPKKYFHHGGTQIGVIDMDDDIGG